MTDITDLPYRPCVGIALFNQDGHVFVGERIDTPGAWQMPQGGIDPGEDITLAALRELSEEVGTDQADIIRISDTPLYYDLPDDWEKYGMENRTLWNGKYRGQVQTWVAARFTGSDADIDLETYEKPEFSAWQWIPLSQTIDLIVPFKRDVYVQVIQQFRDIAI